MNNLHGLYFNEHALNFLTQLILALVVLFYFLRMANKAERRWPPILFFLAIALHAGVELVAATAVWERQFYALPLTYNMLYLTFLAGLQMVYRFPEIPDDPFARRQARELPIATFFYGLAFLASVGWGLYQWGQLRPHGTPSLDYRLPRIGLMLLSVGILLVLVRRTWALMRQMNFGQPDGQPRVPGQRRSTQLVYTHISMILILAFFTAVQALTANGLLPTQWRDFIPTAGVLFLLFFTTFTYFNATLQQTTFVARIIGATLLVLFLILGMASLNITQTYSSFIQVRPENTPAQTIRFQPQSGGGWTATTQPLQMDAGWGEAAAETVDLPFAFPLGDGRWSQVTLAQPGVIGFGDWFEALYAYNYLPAISLYPQAEPENGRSFIKSEASQVTITWQTGETAVQTVLYADGRFDLSYPPLDGSRLQRIGFQSGSGGTEFTAFDPTAVYAQTPIAADGLLVDYDILYHQAQHPFMVPLLGLVLAISLASLLGFPLLFRLILVKPLYTLVDGVREVEAGNLNVTVPITNDDEIGLVTRTFNQMVRAVRDVEQTLETKVEERTAELAESQRQLGAVAERERIGREIHDDLGQVMGYVHMQIEAVLTRLQRGETEQAHAILTEVDNATQEANDQVRQYILGIRTGRPQPHTADFWTTLHAYLKLVEERFGLQVEVTAESDQLADIQHLTPEVETQVLRIVQEGITNIHKHAQATRVHLLFSVIDDWMTLLLKDDGRGFDLAETNTAVSSDHFGLKIMQERAEGVNGRLQISSTPGEGTQLRLQVPRVTATAAAGPAYSWRVLLVDDHALFREGVGNMLRPHGVQIVAAAANGQEAITQAAEHQPDLILMDIQMPEMDGLEATQHIKQQFPQIKIVMLTMADEKRFLMQALKNGASGYLLKNLPAPQFLSLLGDVMAGKTIISPALATEVLTTLALQDDAPADNLPELLTDRQREVLTFLAQGMSNKQIGERLHISENTVKYHVRQMMERLNLQTRHELMRYHLENIPGSS